MGGVQRFICGVVSHSGPHGEPLACGYAPGHDGPHAWASLPTFVDGTVPTTVTCQICGARHNGDYARDFAGHWGHGVKHTRRPA